MERNPLPASRNNNEENFPVNSLTYYLNGIIFAALVAGAAILEFTTQFIERGAGYYLKWHNADRPQLGRIWERDRLNLSAQNQIQSVLTAIGNQGRAAAQANSLGELIAQLDATAPIVISRKKFLDLYFGLPGATLRRIFPPFELMRQDAEKNWDRVVFTRAEDWITISLIDRENLPLNEFQLAAAELEDLLAAKIIKNSKLEEVGVSPEKIFPFVEFYSALETLDTSSKNTLFPDPQWFLERGYRITRIGITDGAPGHVMQFAIEYTAEFQSDILLTMVSKEILDNVLSQFEKDEAGSKQEGPPIPK